MTATAVRPDRPAAQNVAVPDAVNSGARRTMLALLGTALGAVPLKELLSDNVWLIESWLAMLVVLAPAVLLRLRRAPGALDIWPGILLLVPVLTAMFVPHHAWGGFIPTSGTLTDVGHLMDGLHHTTSDEVAPIHSTAAVRLVMCALLGLLAALVDLIAVVGRRGALAGVPLLVVYTVSGAVPRHAVAWFWFAVAAVGFLVLLGLDADDELHDWGRRITRRGDSNARHVFGVSAQRIGIIAVLAAVALPFFVPNPQKNLIADAFHGGSGNGLGSFGAGTGGGQISPFAALKGQLIRDKPTPLMTVHIQSLQPVQPFYARANVLDKYTGRGWGVSSHGDTESLDNTDFATLPPTSAPGSANYRATITVTGLTGNVPVFSIPGRVEGAGGDAKWSAQDQLLLGGNVHSGQTISEDVAQTQPQVPDLEAAPAVPNGPDVARWLALPPVPSFVVDRVRRITAGKDSPYARARAISDWFADPVNNFQYSLKTTKGDSGSDLVDFLQKRSGYCQQYAAAMGVMLRLAGVPSRVVLGYMHPAPDSSGNFKITTFDAHSWVEAFFPGSGWVPFDPTPTAGLTGGKKSDLSWAPHVYPKTSVDAPSRSNLPSHRERPTGSVQSSSSAPSALHTASSSNRSTVWAALVVVVVLGIALAPAGTRAARRRRRYAAARRGDVPALWAELSDTAVDLGYTWSPARSPRQVSAWLARDAAGAAPALDALAGAVEHDRYAPRGAPGDTADLVERLRQVTGELRARRTSRTRIAARFWPASLGWGPRLRRATSRLRRRH